MLAYFFITYIEDMVLTKVVVKFDMKIKLYKTNAV